MGIAPILNKKKKYGNFDGNYYALKKERIEDDEEGSLSENDPQYIIQINSPQFQGKKSYVKERRGSYMLDPATISDMGMSEEPGSEMEVEVDADEESLTPEDPLED